LPSSEHPQVEVAELQSLLQHWTPAAQLVESTRHEAWHKPSAPQVFPVQQSALMPHDLPSSEHPHVFEALLQTRLQQSTSDPPHGAPSALQVAASPPTPKPPSVPLVPPALWPASVPPLPVAPEPPSEPELPPALALPPVLERPPELE